MKIALHETITPGNIGAVARVMKNFGLSELLLIKPQCDYQSEETYQRACHADSIIINARVISEDELFNHFVVGTTSKAFTRKPHRQAVTLREVDFLPENAVILFGREDNGLSNELLEKCDSLITIPASKDYASLNLSHAVAIMIYELTNHQVKKDLANPELKSRMIGELNSLVSGYELQVSNVINRSIIYHKEAQALMGFIKELKTFIKELT